MKAPGLDGERLGRLLADEPFVSRIHLRATVDSTSDELRRLADEGAGPGTVVIAEQQLAGRGRRGRSWHSPPGLGLYLSVLLRSEPAGSPTATRWTLAAGLAACEACRAVGAADVVIEWPNDLFWAGRKLGGILAELRTRHGAAELTLGIGFNVAHRPEDFPSELRDKVTSLRQATGGRRIARETLAAACLTGLAGVAADLEAGRWESLAERWLQLAPGARGEPVRVTPGAGGPPFLGRTSGIAADGALRVEHEDGGSVEVRLADSVMPLRGRGEQACC